MPYTVSPMIGWPIEARCTRIWWVRPVRRESSRTVAPASALHHAKVGHRLATALDDRHAAPVARVTGDRRVDGPGVLAETPVDERPVRAPEGAIAELAGQIAVRGLGFGHHQQATRVAVEAVHDARALYAAEQATRWSRVP